MKINNIIAVILLLALSFTGCAEDKAEFNGTGTLNVGVQLGNKVVVGRSGETDNDLLNECIVTIYNNEGVLIDSYIGIDTVSEVYLKAGSYKVVVEAGEAVAASYDKIAYKGEQEFTIVANQSTNVSVECNISNSLVVVNFDASLRKAFTSYKADVYSSQGNSLTFDNETEEGVTGYFTLTSAKTLGWAFYGYKSDESVATDTEVFTAAPATKYTLKFKLADDGSGTGSAGLITLEVQEEPLYNSEESVLIKQRPVIEGVNFDFADTQELEQNQTGVEYEFTVKSTSPLDEIYLSGDALTGLGYPSEILGLLDVNYSGILVAVEDEYNVVVTLKSDFTQGVAMAEGNYNFTIKAVDTYIDAEGVSQPKEREVVLNIIVGDAPAPSVEVTTKDILEYEVWTKKATLRGTFTGETNDASFKYRKTGGSWNTIEANISENNFSAEISGLDPETEYQFVAIAGGVESTAMGTFTTGVQTQLPNSGFEDWYQTGWQLTGSYVWYPSTSSSTLFWDSGNKGTSLLFTGYKNITKSNEELKHGGNKSAELISQYVGITSNAGQFASGNLYTGYYIKTEGTSGASLSWGRPFTGRPSKLVGYYRYTPGVIDYVEDDLPDAFVADGARLGETDKASIFIALTDWDAPMVINNTIRPDKLFFPDTTEGIIAYGQFVEDSEVAPADGSFVKFEIDIDYRDFTKIPTHVLVVCSASKWGDYFTGGSGSTLYLDDFELIYE